MGERKIEYNNNTIDYSKQSRFKKPRFQTDEPMAATSASSEAASAPAAFVPKIASSNAAQSCEVEFAACECCGLTEECTPAYIARVRERFYGRWVCGLCGEAVKDELCRSDRLIGMEEALKAHMTFCMQFRANVQASPAVRLVGAMRQLLRKSLDSSSRGGLRSTPTSPRVVKEDVGRAGLARSSSCFSTLAS